MNAMSTYNRPQSGRASDACGALAHGVITPPLAADSRVTGNPLIAGRHGYEEAEYGGARATGQGWEP